MKNDTNSQSSVFVTNKHIVKHKYNYASISVNTKSFLMLTIENIDVFFI